VTNLNSLYRRILQTRISSVFNIAHVIFTTHRSTTTPCIAGSNYGCTILNATLRPHWGYTPFRTEHLLTPTKLEKTIEKPR